MEDRASALFILMENDIEDFTFEVSLDAFGRKTVRLADIAERSEELNVEFGLAEECLDGDKVLNELKSLYFNHAWVNGVETPEECHLTDAFAMVAIRSLDSATWQIITKELMVAYGWLIVTPLLAE